MEKTKRKRLTLQEKLKLIEAHEAGKTGAKIARESGMHESSVRSILKKKDFYKTLGSYKSSATLKSFCNRRNILIEKVEEELITWIEAKTRDRIPMTLAEIQKKALDIFNSLNAGGEGREKFKASSGWVHNFTHRIQIQKGAIFDVKITPDEEAGDKFRLDFAKIVQDGGYNLHQIFNVEETRFYWKKIPLDGLETEKNQGCRDNLTLQLGGNAAGDLKLKPMIVYHSETPNALKGCDKNSLPVIWRSNKKGFLDRNIFQEWFAYYFCPTVEDYCREKGLDFKILLLLDLVPSHNISKLHKNIRMVFLPKKTSSILQPMTLGVFPLFKANYLKLILSQVISSKEEIQHFWSRYNIMKGIRNIWKCWCDFSPEDLAGSWHQLLSDVKVKNLKLEMSAVVQEVVDMREEISSTKKNMQKNPSLDIEDVIFKQETLEIDEDDCNQHLNIQDLERIIQSVNTTCELIEASDFNTERSLGIQKQLQNCIQPYIDLYNEKMKV